MAHELTIWEHPLSPYAQKVKIACREKGLAFIAHTPGGIGSGSVAGGFGDASPFGEVPALIDGANRIFDSTIILEYLEAAYPTPRLLPSDPSGGAKARMIEEVMDTRYEAINWGLYEVNIFKRATGADAEAMRVHARSQLAGLHRWLDRQLGEREWFCGGAFGWADLSVAPFVAGAIGNGMGPEKDTPLSAWFTRASARESVAATLAEAAALMPSFEQVGEAVRAGVFKRQYRDHRLEWMMRSGGRSIVLNGIDNGNIRFTTDLT